MGSLLGEALAVGATLFAVAMACVVGFAVGLTVGKSCARLPVAAPRKPHEAAPTVVSPPVFAQDTLLDFERVARR